MRNVFLAVCAASLAMSPAAAVQSTFTWVGTCTDCDEASASLTVEGYTPGTALDSEQFISFDYHSDLVGDFTIAASDPSLSTTIQGLLGTAPGQYDFDLTTLVYASNGTPIGAVEFKTVIAGPWSLTQNLIVSDFGPTHVWNPQGTAAAPEPDTWTMMIGGFGLIGGALRRRTQSSISLA